MTIFHKCNFILAKTLLAVGLAMSSTALSVPAAFAYDEASKSSVNVDKAGIAIKGYDPVAYFTDGKPALGTKEFTAEYQGAIYQFASAAHRDAFKQNPTKYAPQFGGFCAMGAVFEKKLDGDPNLWKVVDGKLFLNVGEPAQKRWLEDIPGNVSKADGNWPKIKDKAPGEL